MSLADFLPLGRRGLNRWRGLRPPAATPQELWRDLRWHAALYREDGLSLQERSAFLALRVIQRLAYNAGWHSGRRP